MFNNLMFTDTYFIVDALLQWIKCSIVTSEFLFLYP